LLTQKLRDSAEGIPTRDTLAQWLDHCHRNVFKVKVTTHEEYGDVIRYSRMRGDPPGERKADATPPKEQAQPA